MTRTIFRRPPLSPSQMEDIKAQRKTGTTWLQLSQQYGISAFTLQKRVEG